MQIPNYEAAKVRSKKEVLIKRFNLDSKYLNIKDYFLTKYDYRVVYNYFYCI